MRSLAGKSGGGSPSSRVLPKEQEEIEELAERTVSLVGGSFGQLLGKSLEKASFLMNSIRDGKFGVWRTVEQESNELGLS